MKFNQWFVGRALAADVLSLSLATKGSRGATRDVAKAKLPTTIHGGLSFGRLLLAYRRPCWPIWFRVAFKPVASIAHIQETVTQTGEKTELSVHGRHDPCVVPRAVPIVESMAALVLLDHLMRQQAIK